MNKFKGNLELNWINKDKSLYLDFVTLDFFLG
jgi:hypothetical protein